jgi:hypothetical protein
VCCFVVPAHTSVRCCSCVAALLGHGSGTITCASSTLEAVRPDRFTLHDNRNRCKCLPAHTSVQCCSCVAALLGHGSGTITCTHKLLSLSSIHFLNDLSRYCDETASWHTDLYRIYARLVQRNTSVHTCASSTLEAVRPDRFT